jgi:hypothetical protein
VIAGGFGVSVPFEDRSVSRDGGTAGGPTGQGPSVAAVVRPLDEVSITDHGVLWAPCACTIERYELGMRGAEDWGCADFRERGF